MKIVKSGSCEGPGLWDLNSNIKDAGEKCSLAWKVPTAESEGGQRWTMEQCDEVKECGCQCRAKMRAGVSDRIYHVALAAAVKSIAYTSLGGRY